VIIKYGGGCKESRQNGIFGRQRVKKLLKVTDFIMIVFWQTIGREKLGFSS
jgi:hypothetical protein